MGMAVAALGSMLGGMAAKAIMPKPTTWGPDTSIAGIQKAVIKPGSGKNNAGEESVPQIDVSQSLAWFKEAAQTQEASYVKGLGYYAESLKSAAKEINAGYTKGNNTLKPLSYSANQALNQQMRMMGLDPIQGGYGQSDILGASLGAYKDGIPTSGIDLSKSLQAKMDEALKIKDPTQREAARQDILALAESGNQSISGELTSKIEAARNTPVPDAPDPNDPKWGLNVHFGIAGSSSEKQAEEKSFFKPSTKAYDAAVAAREKAIADRDAAVKVEQDKLDTWNMYSADVKGILGDFNKDYTPEYDKAFTGEQVEAQVASTPGYQFQVEQGTKAIERQGAAKGMLGSGNTLTALTKYGQDLGMSYYGNYMDNLSRIVAEGSPATMQLSANQINQSKDYGTLIEAGGNAAMQTQQMIGNAYAESLYKSGQLAADAAQFNAQMQFAGIQAGKGRDTQLAASAMGSQAGIMNAQTAAAKQNYGIFQNQQGGAAYAYGASSGGSLPIGGTTGGPGNPAPSYV